MKRLLLGAAVALAAAASAAPVSANPITIQRCYATVIYPCGVCVTTAVVSDCTHG